MRGAVQQHGVLRASQQVWEMLGGCNEYTVPQNRAQSSLGRLGGGLWSDPPICSIERFCCILFTLL